MAELDDITRVGALDEAIRAEERASARARQRLADQDALVSESAAKLKGIATEQREARDLERELETRLARYTRQLNAALRSLETGVGDPEVAERQRLNSIELIDETETNILEGIEHQEHLEERLRVSTAEHEVLTAHRDGVRLKTETELAERDQRLISLRSDRVPAYEALEEDTRRRYDLLLAKKGAAVTTVDKDSCCTKCRMLAPAQQLNEVRRGRLETCRGCGRWLTA